MEFIQLSDNHESPSQTGYKYYNIHIFSYSNKPHDRYFYLNKLCLIPFYKRWTKYLLQSQVKGVIILR